MSGLGLGLGLGLGAHRKVGGVGISVPEFSLPAARYTETKNIELSHIDPSATIYYTTNGTDPTAASMEYTTPIAVSVDTTIKAIAVVGGVTSDVATAAYRIFLATTQAYITRVEADSGYVVDKYELDDDVRFFSGQAINGQTLSASVMSAIGFYGNNRAGLKVASGLVTNLYDVVHNADATFDYTGVSGRRPALTNGDIVFDGVNDVLIGGAGTNALTKNIGESTIFSVNNSPALQDPAVINTIFAAHVGIGTLKTRLGVQTNPDRKLYVGGRRLDAQVEYSSVVGNTTLTEEYVMHVFAAKIKYSDRTAKLWLDGTVDGVGTGLFDQAGNSQNIDSSGMAIGGNYYNNSSYFDDFTFMGTINCVLMVVGVLSEADVAKINEYLKLKYGIA